MDAKIRPDEDKKRKLNGNEEIYVGLLSAQIKLVKLFSFGTSLIGLSLQPMIYAKLHCSANVGLLIGLGSTVGFFTLATPLLIHFICKKYVTKITYNKAEDVYIMQTYSFFLRPKQFKFKVDEVITPTIDRMFTSFFVRKKAFFVDPSTFNDDHHYDRIMGYDKPIDFKKYMA